MGLKEYPVTELPREKALSHGIDSLSNAELLAVLLRCGNKNQSVIDLSIEVLNTIGGVENLAKTSYELLSKIKGMKKSKSLTLLACVELAKRINYKQVYLDKIENPDSVFYLFEPIVRDYDQEVNYCIFVNVKRKVICYKQIYKGGLNVHLIHPRDIFREAIKVNAAGIIIVHNHPSGDPTPSEADIATTIELSMIGRQIGISIIDHIIIGKGNFYSLKSNNII
ncbi:MAG: DNA repair protein RadC [Bacilli bacterium]|nr:DNA repair protein RadC [Bacilli bacterium]